MRSASRRERGDARETDLPALHAPKGGWGKTFPRPRPCRRPRRDGSRCTSRANTKKHGESGRTTRKDEGTDLCPYATRPDRGEGGRGGGKHSSLPRTLPLRNGTGSFKGSARMSLPAGSLESVLPQLYPSGRGNLRRINRFSHGRRKEGKRGEGRDKKVRRRETRRRRLCQRFRSVPVKVHRQASDRFGVEHTFAGSRASPRRLRDEGGLTPPTPLYPPLRHRVRAVFVRVGGRLGHASLPSRGPLCDAASWTESARSRAGGEMDPVLACWGPWTHPDLTPRSRRAGRFLAKRHRAPESSVSG